MVDLTTGDKGRVKKVTAEKQFLEKSNNEIVLREEIENKPKNSAR